MTARLVTVETHTMMRVGYVALISGEPDIRLVAQAVDIAEAREAIDEHKPDVVVCSTVDVDDAGLRTAAQLRSAYPKLGVVLLGPRSDELLFAALEAGLSAYLPYTAPGSEVVSAIRHAAAAPGSFTAPGLATAMVRRQRRQNTLSPREFQILQYLKAGVSNTAMATQMNVTESTVRTYVARLYQKLGVHNRKQALSFATRYDIM